MYPLNFCFSYSSFSWSQVSFVYSILVYFISTSVFVSLLLTYSRVSIQVLFISFILLFSGLFLSCLGFVLSIQLLFTLFPLPFQRLVFSRLSFRFATSILVYLISTFVSKALLLSTYFRVSIQVLFNSFPLLFLWLFFFLFLSFIRVSCSFLFYLANLSWWNFLCVSSFFIELPSTVLFFRGEEFCFILCVGPSQGWLDASRAIVVWVNLLILHLDCLYSLHHFLISILYLVSSLVSTIVIFLFFICLIYFSYYRNSIFF